MPRLFALALLLPLAACGPDTPEVDRPTPTDSASVALPEPSSADTTLAPADEPADPDAPVLDGSQVAPSAAAAWGTPLPGRSFTLHTPEGWTLEASPLPAEAGLSGEIIRLRPAASPDAATIQITHVSRPEGGDVGLELEIRTAEEMLRQSGVMYDPETVAEARAGSATGQERIYRMVAGGQTLRHRVLYLEGPSRFYTLALLTRPSDAATYDAVFDRMLLTFEPSGSS